MNKLHAAVLASGLLVLAQAGRAAELMESALGDFSGDRLAPTPWLLDASVPAPGGGGLFNNVLGGSTGRGGAGVDRDYIQFTVPPGFQLNALRVGNQTQSGGQQGSFIGLASGATMPLLPDATSAAGLLGWRHYGVADRNTDILPAMAVPAGGSSGFGVSLPAGAYTLWIQELAGGSYTYRFNLQLSAVPEPAVVWLMAAGLVALAWRQRSRRNEGLVG